MSRRRRSHLSNPALSGYHPGICTGEDADVCPHCEYVAEMGAHDADREPADPQRGLEAADREAGMGRWSS